MLLPVRFEFPKILVIPDIQILLMSSIKWPLLVFANFTALKVVHVFFNSRENTH